MTKTSPPCESICPKCGSSDLSLKYLAADETVPIVTSTRKSTNLYLRYDGMALCMRAVKEHIHAYCRTCSFCFGLDVLNPTLRVTFDPSKVIGQPKNHENQYKNQEENQFKQTSGFSEKWSPEVIKKGSSEDCQA